MNSEHEILNLFKVEELEKRYEMAWLDNVGSVKVSPYASEGIPIDT